jgi:hypothetical protein
MELAKLEGAAGVVVVVVAVAFDAAFDVAFVIGASFVFSNGEAASAVLVEDDSGDDTNVGVVGSLVLEPEQRQR